MERYKLIKTYPGSPPLGTIIFKNGPFWSNVVFYSHFWKQVTDFNPEFYRGFWEKVFDIRPIFLLPDWHKGNRESKLSNSILLKDTFAKEGDTIYGVSLTCPECYVKKLTLQKLHVNGGLTSSREWFLNQDSAYEYLYKNVQLLSYNDIAKLKMDGTFLYNINEIVKKRIQNVNITKTGTSK